MGKEETLSKLRDALASPRYSKSQKDSLLKQYREKYNSDLGNIDFDIYAFLGWQDFVLQCNYEGDTTSKSAQALGR